MFLITCGNQYVDVVVATPPCQGMSTANYKKQDEMPRNSLVIESLELIERITPRYFVLENVRSFLKTPCLDKKDNKYKLINEAINNYLSDKYNIEFKIINFKEYGVPSSRPRTIVVGTRKDMPHLSPLLVFPDKTPEISLRKSIGHFKSLKKFKEFDKSNPLHMFREYPSYMREWISNLEEGQDSFNFSAVKPYKIVNGKRIGLKGKHLGNKFSRMYWDKPAPAIHTRSDQLASNRTLHPSDDRVLSIAELMKVMSIPDGFKWFNQKDLDLATNIPTFIRKRELNIRRSIGEAVPTGIFKQIAKKIKSVDDDPFDLFYRMQYESDRMDKNAAFYTPQSVVFNVLKNININKKEIKILEPSAGWGTFLPQLIKKFQDKDKVEITLMDIDKEALDKGKKLFKKTFLPKNISIKWKVGNFLEEQQQKYDLIIGNPPYKKIGSKNLYNLFLKKANAISPNISFIVPKTILNSDADAELRNEILKDKNIHSLTEFGVRTFNQVHIETIVITALFKTANLTKISRYFGKEIHQNPKYIFLEKIWIPYRDDKFDVLFNDLEFGVFKSYRDRQITNKYLTNSKGIRVLKSKNLLKNKIINIDGYDKYCVDYKKFTVSKYINTNAIIVPNFTYNFRAASFPRKTITNGSIALLFAEKEINKKDVIKMFNSEDFNHYYAVLQSFSKFTININKTITYYLGVKND